MPLLCGCFIAIRRPVFEASGGFDDGLVLWGFEDAELCMRLWTYGYRCLVLPHVEVEHLFRERFPYPVDSAVNIHNLLRVAVVHLAEARIARLTAELATNQHFPAALARVLESDVWARRQCVRRERTFDDGWFLGQFGITVFDRA